MAAGSTPVVGVVSPGAMGSAVADALGRGGARVVTTVAGRSQRTRTLVARARVELLPDLVAVVREAGLVLSIVPPEEAERVLAAIVASARREGVRPLVADLNAVAPATVRALARRAASAECDLVDGSISGPPPWTAGTTRLYLAGPRAAEVADLPFEGVERIVVGPDVASASAVKMSTASVYKGTTALLVQALLAAHANGVLDHVLDDLRAGAPELVEKIERRLASAASKSERYVAEMHEIAATQAAAGLTPALFEAMAEVYAGVARTELAGSSPEALPTDASLRDLLERLR